MTHSAESIRNQLANLVELELVREAYRTERIEKSTLTSAPNHSDLTFHS